jgi:hypothetical protein
MFRRLGYGGILWLIPYATAIPLLPLNEADPTFFKTIMIVVGTLVDGFLTAHYFLKVARDYLNEGILLALIWIAVNWLLDFVALLEAQSGRAERLAFPELEKELQAHRELAR